MEMGESMAPAHIVAVDFVSFAATFFIQLYKSCLSLTPSQRLFPKIFASQTFCMVFYILRRMPNMQKNSCFRR